MGGLLVENWEVLWSIISMPLVTCNALGSLYYWHVRAWWSEISCDNDHPVCKRTLSPASIKRRQDDNDNFSTRYRHPVGSVRQKGSAPRTVLVLVSSGYWVLTWHLVFATRRHSDAHQPRERWGFHISYSSYSTQIMLWASPSKAVIFGIRKHQQQDCI